jgi:hypothetical protein
MNIIKVAAVAAFSLFFAAAPAWSAVTNLTLAGGCPESEDGPLCYEAGNATVDNVAALLGVDVSEVNYLGVTDDSATAPGFTISTDLSGGAEELNGTFTILDSSITHLAFKADGYFILGEVTGNTGDWSTDITLWQPTVTSLTCPADICDNAGRAYTIEDFYNGGTNPAALSNVRAFSVVPIPAAVWLFGSGLGLLGFMKRKSVAAS